MSASSHPYGHSIHSHVSRQSLLDAHNAHRQEVIRRSNASLASSRRYAPSLHLDTPSINVRSATIDESHLSVGPPAGSTSSLGGTSPTSPTAPTYPTSPTSPISDAPSRTQRGPLASSSGNGRPSTPESARSVLPDNRSFLDAPTRRPRSTSPGPYSAGPTTPTLRDGSLAIPSRPHSPASTIIHGAFASATIFPMVPEYFSRYLTRGYAPQSDEKIPCVIPRFTFDFEKHLEIPHGWTFHIHPEGQPYFYNHDKNTFTDANLFEASLLQRITENIDEIYQFIAEARLNESMPRHYDLALELWMKGNQCYTNYYFANHDNQTVFFLDDYDTASIHRIRVMNGVHALHHIRFELTAHYWYHVQAYPTCTILYEEDLCELRDEMMHNIGDLVTSTYSTSPYSVEDLYKYLALLTPMSSNVGKVSPGTLTLVARFKAVFAQSKLMHWHGLPYARLERHMSVWPKQRKKSWFLKGLSPLLFSAPDVTDRRLQKIWTDGVLHQRVYDETITKLKDEWQDLVLFATVLLNANVAFLSIGTVDNGEGRSAAQIISYISTLTSAGATVLGLLLIRQTKTKNRETAADVQEFLQKRSHPDRGLETMAILFSLPYALVMWSVVCFLGAFGAMVFEIRGKLTNIVFFTCGGFVTSFVIWCIATAWESQPPPEDRYPLPFIRIPSMSSHISLQRVESALSGARTRVPSLMPAWDYRSVWNRLSFRKSRRGSKTTDTELQGMSMC